jgi:hypothetical protein
MAACCACAAGAIQRLQPDKPANFPVVDEQWRELYSATSLQSHPAGAMDKCHQHTSVDEWIFRFRFARHQSEQLLPAGDTMIRDTSAKGLSDSKQRIRIFTRIFVRNKAQTKR